MRKSILITLSVLVFTAALACLSFAKEDSGAENKKPSVSKAQVKEVEGEVSSLTKRSISIVFARDKQAGTESEILLPYGKNVIIEHKKSLSEIQVGDIVSVKYTDETLNYGDGKEENKITAKVIRFISPAAADSPYKKKVVSGETEEEGASLLPLKGAKE
jgi:hypothetical protein